MVGISLKLCLNFHVKPSKKRSLSTRPVFRSARHFATAGAKGSTSGTFFSLIMLKKIFINTNLSFNHEVHQEHYSFFLSSLSLLTRDSAKSELFFYSAESTVGDLSKLINALKRFPVLISVPVWYSLGKK